MYFRPQLDASPLERGNLSPGDQARTRAASATLFVQGATHSMGFLEISGFEKEPFMVL